MTPKRSFQAKRAEYEPSGGKPTTLCRSRWFSNLNLKNSPLENLPWTAQTRGFEANEAEHEASDDKPTTLCRSRWFSTLNLKNSLLKFGHHPRPLGAPKGLVKPPQGLWEAPKRFRRLPKALLDQKHVFHTGDPEEIEIWNWRIFFKKSRSELEKGIS